MTLIRPFGGQDTRVVSDLSRFEYEKRQPRNRSRNTTPTSLKSDTETSEVPVTNDFYEHYANSSVTGEEPIRQFAPYPPSIVEQLPYNTPHQLHNPQPPPSPKAPYLNNLQQFKSMPPQPPPKDVDYFSPRYQDRDSLPPMEDSRDYMKQRDSQATVVPQAPLEKQETKAQEQHLLDRVMNRPVLTFGPKDVDPFNPQEQRRNFHITASNIMDIFQVIFGIVIITLASTLGSQDQLVSLGIYRYFIAVGVITLVVALLFITKAINFDRRNGIFYCLLACVLTGVSLILSITSVATNNNCATTGICQMRKALSTFAILSFFLWLCMFVMFLTTLYISKMNLLEDVNFDYSKKGAVPNPQSRITSQHYSNDASLPQYYLTETGDMYPLENHDTRGKKKIVVYA
ncbi:hypothetical protein FT663_02737 [Candidozyma haemuli var. vulneris]|uniref:MARVEL domain-containing protein n=1 Tax=Candidozyma haemuli TaxID=45357 RepID=A0A2V1APG2_9ASCO|nr:hypothetical protein CXQ85_001440 [[Candida] haemuloni]KAF3989643.1 hypothetical protein FT662_02722 [[Candida] haemuloni var. vulneris]KAF3991439.1 hypothetical protein FT663_02737 [[Candida] haemuloni var. vulneris]PVH19143.1 hypothetical protein CXQ85_001440 [[Candida] haemuloni]